MFKQRYKKRRFILGKVSRYTREGQEKLNYRKNLEKSLAISLLAAFFIFRLTASIDFQEYLQKEDEVLFEFIDLPEPPPPTESPPLQMEQVKELPKAEEPQLNEEIARELESLINETSDDAQLTLASNDNSFLTSESQLGSVVGTDFRSRKLRKGDDDLKIGNRGTTNLSEGSGLDIGKSRRSRRQTVTNDNSSLTLETGKKKNPPRRRTKSRDSRLDLRATGKNERILSFASSTIGTEDYKVWNKINSELDRLNKGRYGVVPEEIKHHRGGFTVRFRFRDGVQHQINWQQDGNVWIKVIGENSRTNLQELRRALNGLISLSL